MVQWMVGRSMWWWQQPICRIHRFFAGSPRARRCGNPGCSVITVFTNGVRWFHRCSAVLKFVKLFVRNSLEVYCCQIRLMRARGKSVFPFQPLESIASDVRFTCKYYIPAQEQMQWEGWCHCRCSCCGDKRMEHENRIVTTESKAIRNWFLRPQMTVIFHSSLCLEYPAIFT